MLTLEILQKNLFSKAKTFKTGSKGHYVHGKVVDKDGTVFQMNANVVQIGSKPQPK